MRALPERRFDVDETFALPALNDIVDRGNVRRDTVDETKVYYDTPEYDLQAQGVALYRRDGDDESGWCLEIPADDRCSELRWAGSDVPPAEAVGLLTGLTAGKPVVDVAKIHTTRRRYRISAHQQGGPCLEVGDDRVRASVGERLLQWRELEVESAAGAKSSAKRLSRCLRAAGARPARYRSKLARVSPPAPTATAANPVRAALSEYLDAQIDQIVAGDIGLRRGQDPIHDTRVAIRRLRSTLRVFGKLLVQSQIGDMDDELRWFAGLLGEVRDCEVQQGRFLEALDAITDDLILGPVKSRIRADLQAVALPARSRVAEAMESPRYLAIMAVLRGWRVEPPVRKDLTTRALLGRARRAERKAHRRLTDALKSGHKDIDRDIGAMLHRARKAAKRARYAAELSKAVDRPRRAKRTVKNCKHIQRVLGDHQDTVVARAALHKMAIAAGTTVGENGFTYGMLYAREQQIAHRCRQQAQQARELT